MKFLKKFLTFNFSFYWLDNITKRVLFFRYWNYNSFVVHNYLLSNFFGIFCDAFLQFNTACSLIIILSISSIATLNKITFKVINTTAEKLLFKGKQQNKPMKFVYREFHLISEKQYTETYKSVSTPSHERAGWIVTPTHLLPLVPNCTTTLWMTIPRLIIWARYCDCCTSPSVTFRPGFTYYIFNILLKYRYTCRYNFSGLAEHPFSYCDIL